MDSAKIQLADKLKAANNILVTVSRNPSVDQLAACIGLSLLLNKFGKHAAAVFSGEVPSTIEFLQPEETLEKTTDSLRDFIIALDKGKADKLRYKVEDNVVRIFITPYRTSISQDDLEFSQGDFNVDVVIALGVHEQEDLDQAITMHGRILHDATVAAINTTAEGGLGSINWNDASASSLSELVTDLAQALGKDLLDNQIATALLTGIVAETERFRNHKTTSETMRASAALMAAGADQQLVASQLEETDQQSTNSDKTTNEDNTQADAPTESPDGTLHIAHAGKPEDKAEEPAPAPTNLELPQPQDTDTEEAPPKSDAANESLPDIGFKDSPRMVTEPPVLGGTLTANSKPEQLDPVTDPLSMLNPSPLLKRLEEPAEQKAAPVMPPEEAPAPPPLSTPDPAQTFTPPPPAWVPPQSAAPTADPPIPPPSPFPSAPEPQAAPGNTLADLEAAVGKQAAPADDSVDSAREEVSKALSSNLPSPEPIQALNATPLGANLHDNELAALNLTTDPNPPSANAGQPQTLPEPPKPPEVTDPNAPPPVPPPFDPAKFSTLPTPPQGPPSQP